MSKILLVSIAFVVAPLAFAGAGTAVAVPECGPQLDSCGGLESDGLYAGCDGAWRDIYVSEVGTYAQVCVDDSAHVWYCPNTHNYNVNNPNCTAI